MEEGLFYPSIHMKIHGHNCLFINNFKQIQTASLKESIFGPLAFLNGVLRSPLAPDSSSSNTVTTQTSSSTKRERSKDPFPLVLMVYTRALIDCTTAPASRMMLMMQTDERRMLYSGYKDCWSLTVHTQGYQSLWRGNYARVMSNVFLSSDTRGGMVNSVLKAFAWDSKEETGIQKTLAAECLSATVTQLMAQPLLYAETKMATDLTLEGRQRAGLIDVLKKTLKTDGIAGVYRGFGLGLGAALVTRSLFQAEIYYLHKYGTEVTDPAYAILTVGLPLSFDLITFPAFTVMRRMMMRSGETNKCSHAFSQIVKNEGFFSLYRGADALAIAQFISAAVFLTLPSFLESFKISCADNKLEISWKKEGGNDGVNDGN